MNSLVRQTTSFELAKNFHKIAVSIVINVQIAPQNLALSSQIAGNIFGIAKQKKQNHLADDSDAEIGTSDLFFLTVLN